MEKAVVTEIYIETKLAIAKIQLKVFKKVNNEMHLHNNYL